VSGTIDSSYEAEEAVAGPDVKGMIDRLMEFAEELEVMQP
jgi:hypothetical protein